MGSTSGMTGRVLQRVSRALASRHDEPIRPHHGPTPAERPFGVEGKSGALRAAVFGVNDGLVSNLALIMGFSGAAVDNNLVVLAGVAGLLAGAFSMGAGEYISMRVQREVFQRLLHLEAHELAVDPEEEHRELQRIYMDRGYPEELARRVSDIVMQDPQIALETHAREELGLDPDELGSPWAAAVSSMVMFAVGASIPLLPFLISSGTPAIGAAVGASALGLFATGAVLSLVTGRHTWLSGGRMLLVGGVAAAVTFTVGRALHVGVG